ncbi:MAG: 2-dehydro-3-deoxygalactonokinase, partial [Clostridia bacterium]|nr:2-dehydro-3-deoxygalactonokinase [Clostridia bacterium]
AGARELRRGGVSVTLPEITPIPFFFIGGVKTVGDTLAQCDMMRGEETELMGILEGYGEAVFVLPGSHSKLVRIDADGRIIEFKTMLTGEMIAAVAKGTILESSVDLSISDFDGAALLDGYRYAELHGINETLFKVRVAKNLFGKDAVYTYSFFLGAILKDEIAAILSMREQQVVIGGKAQIKRATAHILREVSDKRVVELDDATVDSSVVLGAIKIFEYSE